MDRELIERELPDFSGFGELPEDLRNAGPISMPDGTFVAPVEGDAFGVAATSAAAAMSGAITGGAERAFITPVPSNMSPMASTWMNMRYLPRANYESFRSQRFFAGGRALLPPDPSTFVQLMVDPATLPPGSPITESGGELRVPSGYAAVLTGFRQWIGDANAFDKPSGAADDIIWRVIAGATPVFKQGNFPFMMSSPTYEAKEYAIVSENTNIYVEVQNRLDPTNPLARSIPVAAILTGHWFPMDELDDIFRNR